MFRSKLRRHKPRKAIELDILELRVIKTAEENIAAAANYHNFRLQKLLYHYEHGVTQGVHRMANKTAFHMKDQTFSGKEPMLILAVLRDFKYSKAACRAQEWDETWLL